MASSPRLKEAPRLRYSQTQKAGASVQPF